MRKYICILVTIYMFTLTSCADMQKLSTTITTIGGTAGGAIIGQIIGHNTEATLIGAAIGTMLGYIVGNEMDKFDRQRLNYTLEQGISNQVSSWINPDSGNQYWVTPKHAYSKPLPRKQGRRQNHHYTQRTQICRQAEIIAIIDGKRERTYTTACRDANGDWQLQ